MKEIQIAIGSFYKPVTEQGGYAYHILSDDFEYHFSDCFYNTTSQRMEMKAFIESVKYVYRKYGKEINVTVYTKLESQIKALKRKAFQGSNKDLYDSVMNLPTQIVRNIVHQKPGSEYYALVDKLCALEEIKIPIKQDKPSESKSTPLF